LDVEHWLQELGLGQYAEAFREQAVDESVLPGLTSDDLKDLGVDLVGHRRRILDAIAKLQGATAAATPAGDGGTGGASAAAQPVDAERRMVTILFCDMVGSTELSAHRDPEELRDVIAGFQKFCAAQIERFGGHVGLVMGDGLLAYFGYPRARESEAEWALRAGLAILDGIGILPRPGGESLSARIGVATGLVVVGDLLGGGDVREQTVIGETPNLAARFQALAQPGQMICGAMTRRLAGGLFDFEDLGPQAIKGFDTPVSAHRVLRERAVETRFAATHAQRVGEMVGRQQEAALLIDRWKTAVEGEGQVLLLAGDAGIGKSRLLQFLMARVADESHFRIVFQCSPHYRDSPLFPPRRQLELAAGFETGDSPEQKQVKLRALLSEVAGTEGYAPELADFLSISSQSQASRDAPERARQRLLDALAGRILAAAQLRPVLFLVEDAHWIDPSTEELVTQLIEHIRALPVLLVVTYRPEYGCAWLQHPRAASLKLSHLSRAQSRELLADLLTGCNVRPEIVDQVVARADGIPLFLEEMAKSLLETPVAAAADKAAGRSAALAASIPETLNDTLLSRLDRDVTAKQVAQIASAIGREFPFSLLAAIADVPEDRLHEGLESLVRSGLLVRQSSAGQEAFSFRHGLLHEATYQTLLLRRRRELHRRIAETLVSFDQGAPQHQPEVVARHFDEAGLLDRAAAGWLEAGRRALAIGAYREALQDLEAGLKVVQRVAEGRQRHAMELPLQMAKAEALRSARYTGGDEALKACQRTRELCIELGDVVRLVRVLRLEAGITFNRADPDGTQRVGEEFLRISEAHHEPIGKILGHQTLGFVGFFRGDLIGAQRQLQEALAAAEAVGDEAALAELQFPIATLNYLSFDELLLGKIEHARACADEAVSRSVGISNFALSLALTNALIFDRLARDDEAAGRHLAELRQIAEDRGIPYWIALVEFHEGYQMARERRIDEGLARMRKSIATFRSNAIEIEIPFYLGLMAEALLDAGHNDEALEQIRSAIDQSERTGERWYSPELHRLRAEAIAEDDPAAAEVELRHGLSLARSQHALLWELRIGMTMARTAASAGSRETARSHVADCLGRLGPKAALAELALAQEVSSGGGARPRPEA